MTASVGFGDVGGVGVNFEGHVALTKKNGGVGMRCSIVEKLGYFLHVGVCSIRLFGSDGAEGGKHRAVDGSSIIEKITDDFLDSCDAVFVKGNRRGCRIGELDAGAIVDFVVWMRAMFDFGRLSMGELSDGGFDVDGHGELDRANI